MAAILAAFQEYMQVVLVGRRTPDWKGILWQSSEWLIFGALTPLTFYLGQRLPLRPPHLGRNLAVHVSAALVLCIGWATGGATLNALLDPSREPSLHAASLLSWVFTSLPWSVFMYFAVLGTVHSIAYFTEAREREAQAARLAAQLAESRLGALQMQLNPHFLFNSLNAVTVLVRDQNTRDAARMLELLSDVLREVLRSDRPHEIALADELRFLRAYLAIEQVRFSDRLRATFDVDDALLDAAVPGFVLQPLVENALRHGIAKRTDAGRLEIAARREDGTLVLTVRDDGPGPADTTPAGVGLANTRERLRTLYGDASSLTLVAAPGGGALATVRLPFRTLPASEHGTDG